MQDYHANIITILCDIDRECVCHWWRYYSNMSYPMRPAPSANICDCAKCWWRAACRTCRCDKNMPTWQSNKTRRIKKNGDQMTRACFVMKTIINNTEIETNTNDIRVGQNEYWMQNKQNWVDGIWFQFISHEQNHRETHLSLSAPRLRMAAMWRSNTSTCVCVRVSRWRKTRTNMIFSIALPIRFVYA